MKAETTIARALRDWPSLFRDRWDVLDHLLCTIGNGYHWVNGQLVSEDSKRNGREHTRRPKRVGELIQFYPISNYSRILNIPNNVTDDWLRVCWQTALAVFTRAGVPEVYTIRRPTKTEDIRWYMTRGSTRAEARGIVAQREYSREPIVIDNRKNPDYIYMLRTQADNRAHGEKILASLRARFGDRLRKLKILHDEDSVDF